MRNRSPATIEYTKVDSLYRQHWQSTSVNADNSEHSVVHSSESSANGKQQTANRLSKPTVNETVKNRDIRALPSLPSITN
ncbi:hypothetical protein DACRYDRAFT_24020 [Dacryopinax primogenitus]|uniref:Uncharacterized protein n=1 Tax=Dacryopinax primogenitus (strain DJM 731) TaxID=1858805 RepID=M5FSK8_DACPD|nr:uncharacterized protein DACRYDRAFT_24020 [Dacryopinax primogenitus]EJT98893.1 hypothetical protein DACRYDRAFT_24020 [Dacryopinax primogenitus]